MPRVNGADVARRFHSLTRHGSPVDRSALVDFQPLDPSNRPVPFKRYVGRAPRPLPTELDAQGPNGLNARTLARLLFFSAGVTRVTDSRMLEGRTFFRAAMSAGNLHPVELYVVCPELDGVAAGVHHYAPLEHGLTQLREGDFGGPGIVLTGIPWRTAWKYGERGYRHLFWDAGTILANLLAIAEVDGIDARVHVGFVDDDLARLLGLDGRTELPLAIVTLGGGVGTEWPGIERVTPDVEPISPRPIEFPLITEAHRVGNLGDTDAWRKAAVGLGTPGDASPPSRDTPPIEEVILRRGSTRIMRRETAPRDLLTWAMATAARPVTADFVAEGRTLLEHELSVHGIAGVEPGAYRWRAGGDLAPVHMGDARDAAALLCLRQPLGGDSAYTAFHSADLDAVLDALGARGYRAAHLEAGIAAGRLTLAAFALGYGATGLTFFDDAVSRFFEATASCLLVTSVGVPAYRNAPGGLPGRVAELGGYERLMNRLTTQLHRGR